MKTVMYMLIMQENKNGFKTCIRWCVQKPVRKCKYNELNETVEDIIYDEIINYAWDIGIRNAYIQEGGTQSDSFIPKWDFMW